MGGRQVASTVFTGMWALVLAVVMSVGGAGGASSPAASSPAASSPAASSPAASSATAPASASRARLAPLGSVKIPGRAISAPAAIAAGGGRVWVANSLYPSTADAGGWVTELSATTGALIRVVSAGPDRLTDPEAIAVAGNRVWVVDSLGSSVTELNATTGALIRVIEAQRYQLSDPGAIAVDGNHVWVASAGNDAVTEIDASTGALIRVIAGKRYQLNSGGVSVAIAVSGNRVWVSNANGNSVTELNATSGALIRVIAGPGFQFSGPVEVAVSGNRLWVVSSTSDNSSVTVINATTGALIRVIWSLPNFAFAITPGWGGVWLLTNAGVKGVGDSGPDGSVAELRATSGRPVRDVSGPPFKNSSPGGAIAADGTHVWVAGTYFYRSGGWVAELSAATGALARVISG
jgi:DNA-binding beta-propeller fold protein YncE